MEKMLKKMNLKTHYAKEKDARTKQTIEAREEQPLWRGSRKHVGRVIGATMVRTYQQVLGTVN